VAIVDIGTSGWSYDHWNGELYPPGLPPRARLAYYTATFSTVELNASFYRWPTEPAFGSWQRRLPDGFRMTVKAPRGLSHAKRLYDPDRWVERICSGWRALGDKTGALLVQTHPQQVRDDARLDYFLGRFPPAIPIAMEFRHPSWVDEQVFSILERHGAAYCVMSGAGLPCVLRATTPWVYVRLHGPDDRQMYAGSYSDDDLRWWADRIGEWRTAGLDVYAYFNNDGFGHAVRNALTLRSMIS
jgi:uncharacterized protein YecE (DUF72 family)